MKNLQRTYEIMGKFIADSNKVKIHMEPDFAPRTNIQTGEVWLPSNIKNENIYPAIGAMMHECMHLKHTTYDPKEVCAKDEYHFIMNAIEDVRIDRKGQYMMSNSHFFYDQLYGFSHKLRPPLDERRNMEFEARVMVENIYKCLGYAGFMTNDPEVKDFSEYHRIESKMDTAASCLDRGDLGRAKKAISEIAKLFNERRKKQQKQQQQQGHGDPGSGGSIKDAQDKISNDMGGLGYSKDKVFDIDPNAKPKMTSIGTAALSEQTAAELQNLLRTKEAARDAGEPEYLDTDNLTAFYTEDLDELFKKEIVVTPLKSKVFFLLDSSGSMDSSLMDGRKRHRVVASVADRMGKILEDAAAQADAEVEHEAWAFDNELIQLKKTDWVDEYVRHAIYGGGTCIYRCFKQLHDKAAADLEIEGHKVIILITDGTVGDHEIEQIHEYILAKNSDVRVVVLGVGAQLGSRFVTDIVGDNNIISSEFADLPVLEAIRDCFE